MKKVFKRAFIGVTAIIVLLAALYFALGLYYMGGFPCFTWINGIYCTGKSVSEVNAELLESSPYDGIAIMDKSGALPWTTEARSQRCLKTWILLNGGFMCLRTLPVSMSLT